MAEQIRALAITNKGLEKSCANELQEFECTKIDSREEIVIFETESYEKLCELCYSLRSASKIMLYFAEINVENFETDAEKELQKIDFAKFVTKDATFAVKYSKSSKATEDGRIITAVVGEHIYETIKAKVNLTNPEVQIFCYITDKKVHIGLDFSGEDLGKRDYRIFLGHDSLKGNLAFALLKLAKYEPKMTLLDPFCRAGAISIEAALMATRQSPHYYNKKKFAFLKLPFLKINFDKIFNDIDKQKKKIDAKILCYDPEFPNINAAKKNAKIAGVLDEISFSRSDVEWLDIKFEAESVDRIVTYPLQLSKTAPVRKIEKIYDWFFKNSKFLLRKNGLMLVLMKKQTEEMLNKYAAAHNFIAKEKHIVYQGGEELIAVVYTQIENRSI